MNCRHCFSNLKHIFLDLGFAPPSNAFLSKENLSKPEIYYPLKLWVCTSCWLVQTEDFSRPEELFNKDYVYFSSVSKTWLDHSARYAEMIILKLGLNQNSFVVEIASNDGYLLKNFVKAKIPCLGIEPTSSTADSAEKLGIPVLRKFFGENLSQELNQADLIIGNNVFAHVPDINNFTKGLKTLLKPKGTITLEFPHLMQLIGKSQFDTIYHEHYSYFSLYTVCKIFESVDLRVHDVEELSTHGGSLRVFGCHLKDSKTNSPRVKELLEKEKAFGICNLDIYKAFQEKADKIKNDLLEFLLKQKQFGKKVAAYGAAAKGNTLLNYAGVKKDLLSFVCDAAHSKQGKFLPGSHIPVFPPEFLKKEKPESIIILPWNIKEEVIESNRFISEWGGKFITAIPALQGFSL